MRWNKTTTLLFLSLLVFPMGAHGEHDKNGDPKTPPGVDLTSRKPGRADAANHTEPKGLISADVEGVDHEGCKRAVLKLAASKEPLTCRQGEVTGYGFDRKLKILGGDDFCIITSGKLVKGTHCQCSVHMDCLP